MDKMQSLYRELCTQRDEIEHELNAQREQLQQFNGKKRSIIVKKIRGSLYYYLQCRSEGKVKSTYLAPVVPGAIAEEEKREQFIIQLHTRIKELEWDLDSINQLLHCLEKRKRRDIMMDRFTFEVYWKDEITARVYVRGKDVMVSRFTDNPGKQLFADKKMTRYQLGKILELRCWDKGAQILLKLWHILVWMSTIRTKLFGKPMELVIMIISGSDFRERN